MRTHFHSISQSLVTGALLLGTVLSTGCSNLQNNLQDPAVWNRIAEISDRTRRNMDRTVIRQRQGYAEPRREVRKSVPQMDIAGEWYHSHKTIFGYGNITTTNKTNVIS